MWPRNDDGGVIATKVRTTSGTPRCSFAGIEDDDQGYLPNKNVATAANEACSAAIYGSTIIVSYSQGVYRSTDGGISFTQFPLDTSSTFSWVANRDADEWVAKTSDSTTSNIKHWVYDGSWTEAASGFSNSNLNGQGPVYSLGVEDSWVSLNQFTSGGSDTWVARTTDNWATATNTQTPIECANSGRATAVHDGDLYCFFAYANVDSLFPTSNDLGYIVSTDAGATWGSPQRPFIAPSGDSLNPQIAFSADGQLYLVGTHTIGTDSTVFLGTYDGTSWTFKEFLTPTLTPSALLAMVVNDGELFLHFRTGVPNSGAVSYIATTYVDAANTKQLAVTDLTEGDVDFTGTVIIARTDAGETVHSYSVDADSVDQTGTYSTPDCDDAALKKAGVSSKSFNSRFYLSFGDCSDGTGDPDLGDVIMLRVRGPLLNDPSFPNGCQDECQQNNQQEGDFNIPEDISDLGTLSQAPFSFTHDTGGVNEAWASWTFSTASGEIGIIAALYEHNIGGEAGDGNSVENADRVLFQVSPPNPVADFCSWTATIAGANTDFVAGVNTGSSTAIVEGLFAIDFNGALPSIITVDTDTWFQSANTGPYGQANSISCANNQALIRSGTQVSLINFTTEDGTPGLNHKWTIANSGADTTKGVALSADGNFAAWTTNNGAGIDIACAVDDANGNCTAGEVIDTVTVPSGAWKSMKFDGVGAQLFIFTTDFITVYDVSDSTCADGPSGCVATRDDLNREIGPGGDDDAGGGGGIFGISETEKTLFMAFLLVFGVVWMGVQRGVYGGGISALFAIGLGLAYAIGWLPLWVILVVFTASLAIIFLIGRPQGSGL